MTIKNIYVKKNDFDRILLTETLPFEIPIFFSNYGTYMQIKNIDKTNEIHKVIIEKLIMGKDNSSSTIPYKYKIKKNNNEFRQLVLLHPRSQWKIRNFYEIYTPLILHYCSKSPLSLRSPIKISTNYYIKSSWENINQYKHINNITLESIDRYVKHTPTYFTYRGCDRLYKFFSSDEYFNLEKKFSVFKSLDVSKCFDSIYTHSLSWAVKDKSFSKNNITKKTFADTFDKTIRHGNDNETHGIPIGPEISRIFSEIIFQEVDIQTIESLNNEFILDSDYTFRRYVDDVYIFAKDENIAHIVYNNYVNILNKFNLHANESKAKLIFRPFITTKSKLIFEASQLANEFFEKFLVYESNNVLKPKKIHSSWFLTSSFINSIKSLCSGNDANYDDVSSFLIAVITERIKMLVGNDTENFESIDESLYAEALIILLDILFFLYSVSHSVNSSYKLSASLIISHRFSKKYMPVYYTTITQKIYDLSINYFIESAKINPTGNIDNFVHLESLNILLSIHELGHDYLIPPYLFKSIFIGKNTEFSYFFIVSALFYIQKKEIYTDIYNTILDYINKQFASMRDITSNSEKACLFLDLLFCPFIERNTKINWVRTFYNGLPSVPSQENIEQFLNQSQDTFSHIDWKESIDLLTHLEKKELKHTY